MSVKPVSTPPVKTNAAAQPPAANITDVKSKLKDCAYLDLTSLQDGAKSDDIAALQQALKMDPPPKEPGVLDAATRKALHDFQVKMNGADGRFEVDDKVGQQTWSALKEVQGYVRPGKVYLGKQPVASAEPPPANAAGPNPADQKRIAAGAIMKRLSEADPNLGKALSQTDPLSADQKQLVAGYADQVEALPQKVNSPDAIKGLTGADLSPEDFTQLTQDLAGKLREFAGTAPAASTDGDAAKAKLAAAPQVLQQALTDDPDTASTLWKAMSGQAELPADFPPAKFTAASDGLKALAADQDKVAALAEQTHLKPDDLQALITQMKGIIDARAAKVGSADPPSGQQLSDDTRNLLQQAAGRIKLDPVRSKDPSYAALLEQLPTLPGFLQLPPEEQQLYLQALAGDDATMAQQAVIVGTRSPDYGALHTFIQQVVQPAATSDEES
jgi:hypothetical protein